MIDRYLLLSNHLRSCEFGSDVLSLIPNEMEHAKLVQLREELDFFQLVSLQLQKEGEHQLDLHDVRILFDELIIRHPIVEQCRQACVTINGH